MILSTNIYNINMSRLSSAKKHSKLEKKQKFPTRKFSCCARCGNTRGYIGKLGVCR